MDCEKDCMPAGVELPEWAWGVGCAITVCDTEGKILYMNRRSRETFAAHGDIIGHDLYSYHGDRAQGMIRHMLETGDTNVYTISKGGVRKLIWQGPWRRDGQVAGLVELSLPIPAEMPHYDRG